MRDQTAHGLKDKYHDTPENYFLFKHNSEFLGFISFNRAKGKTHETNYH